MLTRQYGHLEIQEQEDRDKARDALIRLWSEAGLKSWSFKNQAALAAHRAAWRHLGKMMLGDDCPECEEWT